MTGISHSLFRRSAEYAYYLNQITQSNDKELTQGYPLNHIKCQFIKT